jgi:hypothetical protein
MATVRRDFHPAEADYLSTAFPQFLRVLGTSSPVPVLTFDPALVQTAFWEFVILAYGSGNITCDIAWYGATATSGVVRWEVQIAAITPETDTQDAETKAFATAQTVDDTHLGTTAHRIMLATVAISNLDSVAAGDEVSLKVSRLGTHVNDTMAGFAHLKSVRLSWSDT